MNRESSKRKSTSSASYLDSGLYIIPPPTDGQSQAQNMQARCNLLSHDFFHETDEFLFFLRFGADVDDLEDVVVGGELQGSDGDVDVVVKEVLGQSAHFLGPCGAEHQHLTVGTNLLDNFADLRFETHVQHSVSGQEREV